MVVITPLSLEYKAMRRHLVEPKTLWHPKGTAFEVGTLSGTPWQVALLHGGEGNLSPAVLTERAVDWLRPCAVIVVGIAGSLKDDIDIGDVVMSTKVYGYHGGKESSEGFQARPQAWTVDHRLGQAARIVDVRDEWRGTLPSAARSKVHFKPIAAGEVVLSASDTTLKTRLTTFYNDAAAIEMESAGVAAAASLNASLPVAIVRGISDQADERKHLSDEGLQPQAAAHAAAFTVALLKEFATACAASRLDTHASPGPGEASWRPLDPVPSNDWLFDLGLVDSRSPAVLELHLIPAGEGQRVRTLRLTSLSDELKVLGRKTGLFGTNEELRTKEPATVISASGAGLGVTRDGQRSAWQPLPKDAMGAVLDPADLVDRLTDLLSALIAIDLPAPAEVGFAIGVTHPYTVAEGRVTDIPRPQANNRKSALPVRVPADDGVVFSFLVSDPKDIADELCLRLLQAFRLDGP
ncbi:hypothetical protein ACSNOI_13970 [Actinomadura kijaniata]|uniref:5'-methylthioadenosine/S-adenosylhomocysteine nucleosidase family protein n=1 Tax=Actinomadura kijaniata TaxID=46161 RepID=UPI003F1B9F7D